MPMRNPLMPATMPSERVTAAVVPENPDSADHHAGAGVDDEDRATLADLSGASGSTVAVRALCAFTAKSGDLDLRFTPSPSGAEGIEGHQAVTARRPAGYQTEVALSGDFASLRVRGRADGWDPAAQRLEEIKTYRGELTHIPDNHRQLHWAQARIYGWLICRQLGLVQVELALIYFNIDTRHETALVERHDAAALEAFFDDQCRRYIAWSKQEAAHRAARDAALGALAFPRAEFRAGQRDLAGAVYRSARAGRCLMAQAPTGIGKTLGVLFGLLRAAPPDTKRSDSGLDKIFYLAAKTPGRQLALDALRDLRRGGAAAVEAAKIEAQPLAPAPPVKTPLPLRVVELVARDKACEHLDKACHGESCPLARGFYDRLPGARQAAVDWAAGGKLDADALARVSVGDESHHAADRADLQGHADAAPLHDRTALRQIALQHTICPYYLGQEMARWADVVVGDYNYWFDTSAMLFAMTQAEGWRVAVAVDEAHNLVERARSMYSAPLSQPLLKAVRRASTHAEPRLKRSLDRLNRQWSALHPEPSAPYTVLDAIPEAFTAALRESLALMGDLSLDRPTLAQDLLQRAPGADLQRLQFDLLHFSRLAECFGTHSLFDVTRLGLHGDSRGEPQQGGADVPRRAVGRPSSLLTLRCIVPATHLVDRFAAARCTVLFSATLSPRSYHADLLGLPDNTAWLDVPSPFGAQQLQVRVAHHISTRWVDRSASLAPIADQIARQYGAAPGHYLAFFSSYDYLDQVFAQLRGAHPQVVAWEQQRQMDEPARAAFLARFTPGGVGVGFAVLGGAFAEGIDLPGKRLIGAFIATLGLPQVNPVNEQIRKRMDELFERRGYDFTYLYPGLQKVAQAAGRVIRSHEDEGVLVLLDDRFSRPQVKELLPAWWWQANLP